MKLLVTTTLLALLLFSCQKEVSIKKTNDPTIEKIYRGLKDSLSASTFSQLDFKKMICDKLDGGRLTVYRIGFINKELSKDFVLVKMRANGGIEKGRIIHLTRLAGESEFNGSIIIQTLNEAQIIESPIEQGKIMAWRKNLVASRTDSQYDPYILLPEVVIVSTYPPGGGINWSDWYNLMSFFNNDEGSGGAWGEYGSASPVSGGSGGGYGTSGSIAGSYVSGGGSGYFPPLQYEMINEEAMPIDFENQYNNEAIDLTKFLKCFSNIPDAGATCKFSLFTDIPVNGDPTKLFNWSTGSPGHTFIKLDKTNSGQGASQYIGFYPKSGFKTTATTAPIDGKFVDNSLHEFDASVELSITADKLQIAINRIRNLASSKYDIDDYNCTDWALEVYNLIAHSDQYLDIPRYHIPDSDTPYGSSTPQGLYLKLIEMKNSGSVLAPNITIPVIGWAGNSTGPCN